MKRLGLNVFIIIIYLSRAQSPSRENCLNLIPRSAYNLCKNVFHAIE